MKPNDIRVGAVYRGTDGRTAKVRKITGCGAGRKVLRRNEQLGDKTVPLKLFAAWAVEEIRIGVTSLAK